MCYVQINIIWDQLKDENGVSRKFSDEHLYGFEIKRSHLLNYCRGWTLSVARHQGVSQALHSLPCDYFGLAKLLKFLHVRGLASWLFPTQSSFCPVAYNEEEFSAHVHDYFCFNDACIRSPSETNNGQKLKWGRPLELFKAFPFHQRLYLKLRTVLLLHKYISVAVDLVDNI